MEGYKNNLSQSLKASPRKLDVEKILTAWDFAYLAHDGQLRKSGEPFIVHPTETAIVLAGWGLDTQAIIAAILHDTIEDGGALRSDIVRQFGEEVAILVDGVTKISDIRLKGSQENEFVENLRKMFLVMAKDIRVVLIKLADRLHNMRTIKFLAPDKQRRNAIETLEVYAPLADRLGMSNVASELEDLVFPYAYPDKYEELLKKTKKIYAEAENQVQKLRRELLNALQSTLPKAVVNVRRKHLYSLFRKLSRPEIGGDMEKIHDLVAARIIVESIEQCYIALGVVHNAYHPVPYLGVSDFIATPKSNGYQSIHTKIFGPDGHIVEIQIRTHAMHEQAEMGVAAHFNYAEAKSSGVSGKKLESGLAAVPEEKLTWVRQLMSWQKEITDNEEYFRTLKFDAFQHRIMVFSPMGDVYDLPSGSTPIDYAYAVHTKLGNQAKGAKVNHKLVPLHHVLSSGDVVEILIDEKRTKPNHEWLRFVVTRTARHAVNKALKS